MDELYYTPDGQLDCYHWSPVRYRLTIRAFSNRNDILAVYALAYCYTNHPSTRQAQAERQVAA